MFGSSGWQRGDGSLSRGGLDFDQVSEEVVDPSGCAARSPVARLPRRSPTAPRSS